MGRRKNRLQFLVWQLVRRIFNPRYTCVACLIISNGRVLLVRHAYRDHEDWDIPGGRKRPWEMPDQAMRREGREELRLHLRTLVALGVDGSRPAVHRYTAEVTSPEVHHRPSEIAEARWFPLDRLPERLTPGCRITLTAYRARLDRPLDLAA